MLLCNYNNGLAYLKANVRELLRATHMKELMRTNHFER